MKGIWAFLSKPHNLAILVAIGGVLAFVWKEVVKPQVTASPPAVAASAPPPPPAVNQTATAEDGNAVISNGSGAVTITSDRDQ